MSARIMFSIVFASLSVAVCSPPIGAHQPDTPRGRGPCPSDVNGDLMVNVDDVIHVMSQWGSPCEESACSADVDGNDSVDSLDILQVLADWGLCPNAGSRS